MNQKYANWIAANYPDRRAALAMCAEATERMATTFPELKRIRGHVFLLGFEHGREHWWCADSAGNIIDPTKIQYEGYLVMGYEEWNEENEEPCGKCMNCGEYCFKSQGGSPNACSDSCWKILASDF